MMSPHFGRWPQKSGKPQGGDDRGSLSLAEDLFGHRRQTLPSKPTTPTAVPWTGKGVTVFLN